MQHLPFSYKAQKITRIVLLVDFLVILAVIVFSALYQSPVGRIAESILMIILYITIFICIFSREEIEDEFISSLRLRSLTIVAVIGFATIICLDFIHLILPPEKYLAMKEWRMEHFWNGNFFIILALLYFLILKLSIKRTWKSDEEQA